MRRSFSDFKRFIDDSGLSMSQAHAMMQLYHCGECGVSDIGQHLGITKPAASQMIERLVQQGFLARSEDPKDRRYRQLTLTPQGRSLIEGGIEARRKWMEQLTTLLTPGEHQTIVEALALLAGAARELESDRE